MDSHQLFESEMVYKRYKLVDDFGDYLRAGKKYSHNTIKNYLSDIRHFFGYINMYFADDFESMNISPQIIFQYKQSMMSINTSTITIKRRLTAVNRFIEFLASIQTSVSPAAYSELVSKSMPVAQERSQNSPLITLLNQFIRDTQSSSETRRRVSDFLQFSES